MSESFIDFRTPWKKLSMDRRRNWMKSSECMNRLIFFFFVFEMIWRLSAISQSFSVDGELFPRTEFDSRVERSSWVDWSGEKKREKWIGWGECNWQRRVGDRKGEGETLSLSWDLPCMVIVKAALVCTDLAHYCSTCFFTGPNNLSLTI